MNISEMKRAAAVLAAVMTMVSVSACGSSEESSAEEKTADSKTETSAAASEKETAEKNEAADTTAAEAPDEPAEQSAAEDETPEPEPESEPEPEVDIKAMLEGYDDAYMVFDENTDPYALFSPSEAGLEDAVMPDFSMEEVGGIPMIKVYTDTTFEAENGELNEETQTIDWTIVDVPCHTQFKLNFDALALPADSRGVTCHFLLKATSDSESVISVVGYDYNDAAFFHSGDNDNAFGDGMDNGYATAGVLAKNDIDSNYFYVSSTYDNFEVYITHISIN